MGDLEDTFDFIHEKRIRVFMGFPDIKYMPYLEHDCQFYGVDLANKVVYLKSISYYYLQYFYASKQLKAIIQGYNQFYQILFSTLLIFKLTKIDQGWDTQILVQFAFQEDDQQVVLIFLTLELPNQIAVKLYSMINVQKKQSEETSINCLRYLSVEELFKEALHSFYSQKYFRQYSPEFAEAIFVFELSYQNKYWIVVKNNRELMSFIRVKEIHERLSQNTRHSLHNQSDGRLQYQAELFQNALAQYLTVNPEGFKHPFFQYERDGYGSFWMKKRSGGRYRETACCKFGQIIQRWKERIVNIYEKGVAYYNQRRQVRQFLSFSQGFYFQFGKPHTGLQFGVFLYANHRQLSLQAKNIKQFIYFIFTLRHACRQSSYMALNRFNSFAPVRYSNSSKFYVDGQQYFGNLADSLMAAKKSVLIQGWVISPEFLLKRKPEKVSLQNILEKLSQKQVKISIIVYHQSLFLPNGSLYAKEKLEMLKNVIVLRHPCGTLPVLWSHHTKMVIIDQELAYVGGLDLSYGRFDNQKHQLFPNPDDYPGIQHNNVRKNDQYDAKTYEQANILQEQCRLPWHDIGHSLRGEVVADLVHHFYQLWNFVRYENRIPPSGSFPPSLFEADVKSVFSTKENDSEEESILRRIGTRFHKLKSKSTNMVQKIKAHIRKNFDIEVPESQMKLRISATESYFQRYVKEIATEIERKEKGETTIEKKKSRFRNSGSRSKRYSAQEIKEVKQSILKQKDHKSRGNKPHSFLLTGNKLVDFMSIEIDKDYVDCLQRVQNGRQTNQQHRYRKEIQSDEEDSAVLGGKYNQKKYSYGRDQCQAVRSVGNWSIGCHPSNTEFSIHIAYLQLISQAKHYIYIENQFFISSTSDPDIVKNEVALALYLRIKKAIHSNQNFKVMVIIPLLPGFAGDLETQDCLIMRKEMQWQYNTICRGENSLWQKLLNHTNDPSKYIQFLSLRTHGRFTSITPPQTEIIYVHAKLMIIDDETILCGSANINDRSLAGDRDSEFAIITRGEDFVEGRMNGEPTLVSQIAQQLRIKLWKEHFDFKEEEMIDPIDDVLWQLIADRASMNTSIYRRVFGCYPDDQIRSKNEVQVARQQSNIELYDQLSVQIKGHVVQFPLHFLQEENLVVLITQKEFYMPEECLT